MDLDGDGGSAGMDAKPSSQLRTLIDGDGCLIDESVACSAAPITCTPTVSTYSQPTEQPARLVRQP